MLPFSTTCWYRIILKAESGKLICSPLLDIATKIISKEQGKFSEAAVVKYKFLAPTGNLVSACVCPSIHL